MMRALCAATLVVCAVSCTKPPPPPPPPRALPLAQVEPKKEAAPPPVVMAAPKMAMKKPSAPNNLQVLNSLGSKNSNLDALLGKSTGGTGLGMGLRGSGSGGGGKGEIFGGRAVNNGGVSYARSYGSNPGAAGAPSVVHQQAMVMGFGTVGSVGGHASGGRAVSYPTNFRAAAGDPTSDSEEYGHYAANVWTDAEKDHLSTFAADVDTASYTVARRKLLSGTLPPTDSVRVEEWLNYFRYHYPQPTTGTLGVSLEAAPSPFAQGKTLLRVGVQGKQLSVSERKTAHLVFLVDVSGSMQSPDKLPLAKRALRMLVDNLRDGDTVSMVTYANGVQLVLGPTPMDQKSKIHEAIENLHAGGGTAMGGGIETAYAQAAKTLDSQSYSRVIVLSDGDANIGKTSHAELLALIAGKVKEGVTVTTVGFGMGNYKDTLMEQFADKGNGNHFYCDSLFEAQRIFVKQLGATLEVIAQDVKFQVDFDPAQVRRYRLVGYENRNVADTDFRNDKVDGGEIGSGHQVTAMYEVELLPGAQQNWAKVHVRAKKPRGTEAAETVFALDGEHFDKSFDAATDDFRFASAVMGAAEIFRRSSSAGDWSYAKVLQIAQGAAPADSKERQEFVMLLQQAKGLAQVASR